MACSLAVPYVLGTRAAWVRPGMLTPGRLSFRAELRSISLGMGTQIYRGPWIGQGEMRNKDRYVIISVEWKAYVGGMSVLAMWED